MEVEKSKVISPEYEKLLKEMEALQATFLDNMSHELRTPITVILGYAGILCDEIEDPDLKEMAEIVLKSSNRLTETLNLLLDQSDIQSEKLDVDFVKCNMAQKLKTLVNIYQPVANDKNISINLISNREDIFCNVDVKMFEKALDNILSNAIKYTNSGTISIKLNSFIKDDKAFARMEIIDSGIGIEEDKQAMVFEAFRQVSEGMNRLYQGTGLGLSVTKKFIEIMHGEISVKSKVNEGTTFTILLPQVGALFFS
ncbi:MAG: HAMP domain-containing sensor histidine kinase [Melioribacteraceae bacterium]